jgi:Homeodomain-like domain-containing protein
MLRLRERLAVVNLYEQLGSYRAVAGLVGCDHKTVKAWLESSSFFLRGQILTLQVLSKRQDLRLVVGFVPDDRGDLRPAEQPGGLEAMVTSDYLVCSTAAAHTRGCSSP